MAWTQRQSGGGSQDANTTTVTCALTGVLAGSLVFVYFKFEGAAASVTSISDGTDNLDLSSLYSHANGDFHVCYGWLLASTSGNKTYTATLNAARPFKRLVAVESTYSGSASVVAPSFNQSNGSTALSSGNITTTQANNIMFGSHADYSGDTSSAEQLRGSAKDSSFREVFDTVWWKVFSASGTGQATATISNSVPWIGGVIAFEESAGAATERHQTRRMIQAGGYF